MAYYPQIVTTHYAKESKKTVVHCTIKWKSTKCGIHKSKRKSNFPKTNLWKRWL